LADITEAAEEERVDLLAALGGVGAVALCKHVCVEEERVGGGLHSHWRRRVDALWEGGACRRHRTARAGARGGSLRRS
jgi:hypothetical protein